MRKTLIFLAIAAAIFISYSIWPFVGMYGLLQAVQTRDMAEINARVDFKELRRSLTEQLVRTYLRLTGKDKNLNSFAQNLVIGAVATVADPIVAKMVSPEALADLLQNGWPTAALPDRPPGLEGISIDKLGSVWQLYSNSEYGIGDFHISIPPDKPASQRFRLAFHLSSWMWRFEGIDLPQDMRIKLAQEIMKAHPE